MTSYMATRWSAIRREDIVVGPQSGGLFRVVTLRPNPAEPGMVIASLAPYAGFQRLAPTLILERPAGELVSTYITDDSRAVQLLVTQLDARVLGWSSPGDRPDAYWSSPSFIGDEAGLQHHVASMHADHLMSGQTGAALLAEHAEQHAGAMRDGSVNHWHTQDGS